MSTGVNVNSNGNNLKVNGVIAGSNEFSLPLAPSYEFKFRVSMGNRGIIGAASTIVGRANITYAFEEGKTYLVNIDESGGSKVGAAIFGVLAPASFKIVLYKYSSDLNEKTICGEFEVEKLSNDEF